MPSSEAVLRVDGVSRRFDQIWALEQVTFAAPAGALVGLVGPNGSGKSTLVNCVVGLDSPTAGSVRVAGQRAGSDAARRLVAFAPDELPLPEMLTGHEYLALTCALEHRDPSTAVALASIFGLDGHLDKLVGAYSHGMKRRLQFSTTLSSPAPLIVMDEPFSGLDLEAAVLLGASLAHIVRGGQTVLLTIHDVATAERECDRVVVLSQGSVVAEGSPVQIVSHAGLPSLEDVVLEASGITAQITERVGRLADALAVAC